MASVFVLQHVHSRENGVEDVKFIGVYSSPEKADAAVARLTLCRRLLLVAQVAASVVSTDVASIEPAQPRCCPQCGGTRLVYRELEAADPPPRAAPPQDSS